MSERTVGTTPPRVMAVAGTDSGGGAGAVADLRAFAACGVHGCLAVTAVTVQNTVAVTGVHRTILFQRATVIMPNLDEVRLFVGIDVHDRSSQYDAAKMLHGFGARNVVVKGGHLVEDTDVCVDLLYDGTTFTELSGPRFDTGNTHGSGDNMAAATASALARGMSVPDAVAFGKRFIVNAVRNSYSLGSGHGPVSPLWATPQWW